MEEELPKYEENNVNKSTIYNMLSGSLFGAGIAGIGLLTFITAEVALLPGLAAAGVSTAGVQAIITGAQSLHVAVPIVGSGGAIGGIMGSLK